MASPLIYQFVCDAILDLLMSNTMDELICATVYTDELHLDELM